MPARRRANASRNLVLPPPSFPPTPFPKPVAFAGTSGRVPLFRDRNWSEDAPRRGLPFLFSATSKSVHPQHTTAGRFFLYQRELPSHDLSRGRFSPLFLSFFQRLVSPRDRPPPPKSAPLILDYSNVSVALVQSNPFFWLSDGFIGLSPS